MKTIKAWLLEAEKKLFGVTEQPTQEVIWIAEHILKEADFVQCMGILNIGNQGEPFDEQVLEKIKELKTRFEGLPIAVDGGVSLENAKALIDAGATRLVVGSAIWKSGDPIETIQAFKRIGAGFEA